MIKSGMHGGKWPENGKKWRKINPSPLKLFTKSSNLLIHDLLNRGGVCSKKMKGAGFCLLNRELLNRGLGVVFRKHFVKLICLLAS